MSQTPVLNNTEKEPNEDMENNKPNRNENSMFRMFRLGADSILDGLEKIPFVGAPSVNIPTIDATIQTDSIEPQPLSFTSFDSIDIADEPKKRKDKRIQCANKKTIQITPQYSAPVLNIINDVFNNPLYAKSWELYGKNQKKYAAYLEECEKADNEYEKASKAETQKWINRENRRGKAMQADPNNEMIWRYNLVQEAWRKGEPIPDYEPMADWKAKQAQNTISERDLRYEIRQQGPATRRGRPRNIKEELEMKRNLRNAKKAFKELANEEDEIAATTFLPEPNPEPKKSDSDYILSREQVYAITKAYNQQMNRKSYDNELPQIQKEVKESNDTQNLNDFVVPDKPKDLGFPEEESKLEEEATNDYTDSDEIEYISASQQDSRFTYDKAGHKIAKKKQFAASQPTFTSFQANRDESRRALFSSANNPLFPPK